jgi:hypothetical protein
MAQAPETARADTEQIFFELDRFELADGRRLELSGRWFGVRGRRFVRPTLTLLSEDARSRSLADLEHKPWSAEDGEPWTAAFPCDPAGVEVLEAELAVAPDIAVTLPPPGDAAGPERRSVALPRPGPKPGGSGSEPRAKARRKERAELAEAELASALSRRDAAVSKLDAVLAERDEVVRARDELVVERDALVAERDALVAERDALVAERDKAAREQASMARAYQRMGTARGEALSARDTALARVQRVEAELTQLRDQLERERAERERAERERLAAVRAQPAPSPPSPAPIPPRPSFAGRRLAATHGVRSDWLRRGLALLVLLAAAVALVIVLQSP